MRSINYIEETGTVNGVNFDGRFKVKRKGWEGIAVYLLGYWARYRELDWDKYADEYADELEIVDEAQVVAVMVGDNRRHIVNVDDLVEISPEDYCPSCGQIGCGWH